MPKSKLAPVCSMFVYYCNKGYEASHGLYDITVGVGYLCYYTGNN